MQAVRFDGGKRKVTLANWKKKKKKELDREGEI
jgi:hypothetical protein